jgi:hypothetical protein
MAGEPIDELAVMETLHRLATHQNPIDIKISLFEMHLLLVTVQLTVRHPKLGNELKLQLRAIGSWLQENIGQFTDAEFRRFLEAGWLREYDR